MKDVAIIGAGITGITTAARLQALGFTTVVLEAQCVPECCIGLYRRGGFSFDMAVTDVVDFEPETVGSELLESVGMGLADRKGVANSMVWLPDRTMTFYRESVKWQAERLRVLGDTPAHREFWTLIDEVAAVFQQDRHRGIQFPYENLQGACAALCGVGIQHLHLARSVRWSLGDALRRFRLTNDSALVGLLSLVVDDTDERNLDCTPLMNVALEIARRTSPLTQPSRGMRSFWQQFGTHYEEMGGELRVGCAVEGVDGPRGNFRIITQQGSFHARAVVMAQPASLPACIGSPANRKPLHRYLRQAAIPTRGKLFVLLGVPEHEVAALKCTEHRLLASYNAPPETGNTLHISVSLPGDLKSAPPSFRSVMISTECGLDEWDGLSNRTYRERKEGIGETLVLLARRVYPNLGDNAVYFRVAAPPVLERWMHRPCQEVAGDRPDCRASIQQAAPHRSTTRGVWIADAISGSGAATAACILNSRSIAREVASDISLLNCRQAPHFFRGLA